MPRQNLLRPIALVSLSLLSPFVFAETVSGSIGLRLGTSGIGLDYTLPLNDYVDLRAAGNFGSLSRDESYDDIDYEMDYNFSSVAAFADIRPFRGGFRVTAGGYSSAPDADLSGGDPDNVRTYNIGDETFNAQIALDGDADLGSFAPYLGIGWGGTTGKRGFGMSLDVGVMFADSPDVTLNVTGTACDASANSNCDPNDPNPPNNGFDVNGNSQAAQDFQAQKEQEVERIERDASDLDLYPVATLGFHYRF